MKFIVNEELFCENAVENSVWQIFSKGYSGALGVLNFQMGLCPGSEWSPEDMYINAYLFIKCMLLSG